MELIWRRAALRDFENIHDWIVEDNPAAAARVIETIRTAINRLSQFPSLGRPGRIAETRELVISAFPYVVAYRVVDDQVVILRIIHTSRQWPRRL